MDGLQGTVLVTKLTLLEAWTLLRREPAGAYDESLTPKGFRVLKPRAEARLFITCTLSKSPIPQELMETFMFDDIGYGSLIPCP